MSGMLCFARRRCEGWMSFVGTAGKRASSSMSEDEAWIVISREWVVVLDVCLECCFDIEERVDTLDASPSLSEEGTELSSRYSSGMDSAFRLIDGLLTNGKMVDHGGDSFIKSSNMGSEDPECHLCSFCTTHGFWVQRSFEKYALQACALDSACPWSSRSSKVAWNSALNSSRVVYCSKCRLRKWQKAWWKSSNLKDMNRLSSASSISCDLRLDGGSGGPTWNTSSMTSSDSERKMSSLTSRSCRTQALLSSSKLGWSFFVDNDGGMKVGPDSGMGMGCAPEQYPQVPLVSQANCMRRLHREYSGPVESTRRRGTFGKRGDVDRDMANVVYIGNK
jgi:hypothetical protein